MTVKELREFLKDLPDDADVVLLRSTPEVPTFTYRKVISTDGIRDKCELEIS